MNVRHAVGLSDTGRRRRRNEDAYVLDPPLFAVADGMGGAQAGEIASRLAAAALTGDHGKRLEGAAAVAGLVQSANRRVYERSSEDAAVSGMGTTMTLALVEDGRVTIGHVGDSRAYRIRDGRLEQLTQDHSLVAELVRSGKLSPAEAGTHPQRAVITRVLGTDPDVDVDTVEIETRPGDLFLLCSDGLTTMVGDDEILQTVETHRDDLEGAARALVSLANRGGGEDNITVVFFEIADPADTAELPAATDDHPDEEDTLSGLELPTVENARPPEPLTELGMPAVEAPAAKPRRSRTARVLATVGAVALLLGLLALLLWGLST